MNRGQSVHKTDTHRFEELADGVYLAVGTGSIFVQSNSLVIVNRDDVIVVDSHVTPAAARALIASIKSLTDKPIRYVINTHYHFDHAHGNQVFGDDVEIIGHEFTRLMLLSNVLEQNTYRSFAGAVPAQIEAIERRVTAATDPNVKKHLEEQLRVTRNHLKALAEVRPTPPDLTLKTSMSLFRGDREIQLRYLGRGHTGGDVVVFLPKERVVFTGDLLLPFLAYMGDAFVDEWPATLGKLKALEANQKQMLAAPKAAARAQRPQEDPNKIYKVDMANSISRGPKDAPITLVEITAFQLSGDMRWNMPSRVIPALLTRTSTGPRSASTWATPAWQASKSETSHL